MAPFGFPDFDLLSFPDFVCKAAAESRVVESAGRIDVLHVDTAKGKKAWKRPLKREDAFHLKGYGIVSTIWCS